MGKYKTAVINDLAGHKAAYLTIVFILLVGMSAGAYTAAKLPSGDKEDAVNYIAYLVDTVKHEDVDFFSIFYHACLQNFVFFAIIIMFSFWPLTIPFIYLAEAIKGFYIGFAIGVLTLEYTANAFLLVLLVVMLPNLILLPCAIKAGVSGIGNAVEVFKRRRIPSTSREKLQYSRPYLIKMMKIFAVSLAGVLTETILTPFLIRVV